MEYGLQLYSVRDFTAKDLAKTLEAVAKIGYKYVEFAGFFGHDAKEVKAMLDGNGLKVSGTHCGLGDLDADFAGTVKYHQTLGNTDYILGGAPWGTAADLNQTIEKLNYYKPLLAAEGIQLGYHNHDGEFKPNQDGQIAHIELQKRTDVHFEIDTYWAFAAGKDPIQVITELKDRIHVIHLKDGDRNKIGYPLGQGEAPVAAVREKAIELGMMMVVESENLNPDGLSEVKTCFDYLMTLEK